MIFTVIIISIITGWAATYIIRFLARRYEVGAYPDERMVHKGFVPIMGGIGIFTGFFIGLLTGVLFLQENAGAFFSEYWGILAGSFLVFLTGIYDDIRGMNAPQKFLMQFIAVSIIIMCGCSIQTIALPFIDISIDLGILAIPFTYLWIIGISNAVNLLDGLDGLAGGVCLVVSVVFAIYGIEFQNEAILLMSVALAGSLIGFLRFNIHPASIFMGDTGSLFLGFFLASLSIKAFETGIGELNIIIPILALAIPIGDTSIAFFRRLNQGHHPFKPDKDHLHHRLMYLGLTHTQTVYTIHMAAILFGLAAYSVGHQAPLFAILIISITLISVLAGLKRIGYLEAKRIRIIMGDKAPINFQSAPAPISLRRLFHKLLLLLSDIIMINLTLYITWLIRFHFQIVPAEKTLSLEDISLINSPVPLVLTFTWIVIFVLNDLYKMNWDVSRFDQVLRVTKTILFGIIVLFLITLDLENPFSEGRIVVAIYAAILIFLINTGRLLLIFIEKAFKILEYRPHPSLLVGTNEKVRKLLKEIGKNPHFLYDMVGYVSKENVNKPFYSLQPLGTYNDIPDLIRQHGITEVIIAGVERSRDEILQIVATADQANVAFKIIPQMYDVISGHKTEEIIGHPLLRLFPSRMHLWQWTLKRTFDIISSTLFIIISIPLAFLIFILQLMSDIHPPMKIINTVGKNGNVFGLLVLNTSSISGKENRLGNLLRRTRFYKFPSLINVLMGKMSIVGPRPETVSDVEHLSEKIKFYNRRFQVRPGLTGWAQVKYRYDDSVKTRREQFKQDLFYLENISLMFDLRIILRSMKIFLFGR
ncbi:MAG: sugar transferase [Calditrichaceae bacterium]|nr:sugar transferase [Calditrichaceae bacterium]MBN2707689.1 sugar transferase [Calditrichaceae bacterium]RQV96497.1 MAG: hypothetical protein EH224_04570 [Calditrichota bacterium]